MTVLGGESMEKKEKKGFDFKNMKEETIEVIVAIMLGVTAIFTAWASWIGSLHGGNQATNYTESNNLSAEGNSLWNEASQNYMQDMMIWNEISQISIDLSFAEDKGDTEEAEKLEYKLDQIISDNCTEEFQEAIYWAIDQEDYATPFDMEGYADSYYAEAKETIALGDEYLEEGKLDNKYGDACNLVTVIYSLVLFLLGIVGIFKKIPNRMIIVCVAAIGFIIATIYMITIPLPTGFSIASFFQM